MDTFKNLLSFLVSPLFNNRGEVGDQGNAGDQGNQGSAAGSQGDQGQQAGQGQGQQDSVPINVVQEIRDELKAAKEERDGFKEQLALYQANSPQGQVTDAGQGQGGQNEPSDDDLMTYGEFRERLGKESQKITGVLGEMRIMQQNPDYADVIKTHLPNVLKTNPALQEAIKTSQNPWVLAYALGKTDPEYIKKQQEANLNQGDQGSQGDQGQQAVNDAQRILDNARKPGSAALAAGAGGGISGASMYENMTDEQIRARGEEIKRRE